MFAIENIAEGFAAACVASRSSRFIDATIERIGGDREIYCQCYYVDEDDDGIPVSGGSSWTTIWASDFLGTISTFRNNKTRQYEADDFSYIKDWSEFCKLVRDVWECGPIMTRKEMGQEIANQRRKKLESVAAGFASKCGFPVGTREYVLAARKEIDSVRSRQEWWNNPEMRMEHWGACGGRSEVYYDDLNFENSRYDSRLDGLGEVLEWLEQNCPLLMRQMEE